MILLSLENVTEVFSETDIGLNFEKVHDIASVVVLDIDLAVDKMGSIVGVVVDADVVDADVVAGDFVLAVS